jgi:hypothetical protein
MTVSCLYYCLESRGPRVVALHFTAGGGLGLWAGLKTFEATHNLITGCITSLPPNLEVLDVSNNFMGLVGDLPHLNL